VGLREGMFSCRIDSPAPAAAPDIYDSSGKTLQQGDTGSSRHYWEATGGADASETSSRADRGVLENSTPGASLAIVTYSVMMKTCII